MPPPIIGGLCEPLGHKATSHQYGRGALRAKSDDSRVCAEKPFDPPFTCSYGATTQGSACLGDARFSIREYKDLGIPVPGEPDSCTGVADNCWRALAIAQPTSHYRGYCDADVKISRSLANSTLAMLLPKLIAIHQYKFGKSSSLLVVLAVGADSTNRCRTGNYPASSWSRCPALVAMRAQGTRGWLCRAVPRLSALHPTAHPVIGSSIAPDPRQSVCLIRTSYSCLIRTSYSHQGAETGHRRAVNTIRGSA
jgi:hypothetical protein